MVKTDDLYNATDHGLEIILLYYPNARNCVGTNKHFKIRPDEKTESACIKLFNPSGDCPVYKVTDFGGEGTAQSPLDIVMAEEGIKFNEAVLKMAAHFNVCDELNHSINKPDIRQQPAPEEWEEGQVYYEFKEAFSEAELKVMGPFVKQEHCDALNWHSAKWVAYVKNRQATYKYATENYPIFIRQCYFTGKDGKQDSFFKIYEPLNPDKGFRFSYTPKGKKPADYINGFHEFKKIYDKYNASQSANIEEGKEYTMEKLGEVFICSGERDAICIKSMGFSPVWLNAETAKLSELQVKRLSLYANIVYNVPDIDKTGIEMGKKVALNHMDIHTVWLPESLREYRDNRGKPRKDLRDYIELKNNKFDFIKLLKVAYPAKFWTTSVNSKTNKTDCSIDSACLKYFLGLQGFFALKDKNLSSTKFIRIKGHVVSVVQTKDLRQFLQQWTEENYLERDVVNLVINSNKVDAVINSLKQIDLDFSSANIHEQFFFFDKSYVKVSADKIEEYKNESSGKFAWEDNVIKYKFKQLPDMFTWSKTEDIEGNPVFDLKIENIPSNVMGYVVNSCRLHWRREMETSFEDESHEEQKKYAKKYKFCLDGPRLTQEEIQEQKLNFLSRCFAIGYLLHQYKSQSRAWATYGIDNRIDDDGVCSGRSGKSFIFTALEPFLNMVRLSGRNSKLLENNHVFDQVTKHSDLILVDDCCYGTNVEDYFDMITGSMTINPKNNQSYTLPFIESPKFAFTSNYPPRSFQGSTVARILFMVYSDYYHQKSMENDYLETRSIRDDFGKDLFSESYTDQEWNADINFFMQCVRLYLSLIHYSIKLQPPLDNIIKRKLKQDMGTQFEEWAVSYFDPESEHIDAMVIREEAFNDYKTFSGLKILTMNRFTKALRGFVELSTYISELNPPDLCNSSGRIIRKKTLDDGTTKSTEYIYLRSVSEAEKIKRNNYTPKDHDDITNDLPFLPEG